MKINGREYSHDLKKFSKAKWCDKNFNLQIKEIISLKEE